MSPLPALMVTAPLAVMDEAVWLMAALVLVRLKVPDEIALFIVMPLAPLNETAPPLVEILLLTATLPLSASRTTSKLLSDDMAAEVVMEPPGPVDLKVKVPPYPE